MTVRRVAAACWPEAGMRRTFAIYLDRLPAINITAVE